jgi:hypothetical protein
MTAAQLSLFLRADISRVAGLDMLQSGDMIAVGDADSDEFGVARVSYGLVTAFEAGGLMVLPASE